MGNRPINTGHYTPTFKRSGGVFCGNSTTFTWWNVSFGSFALYFKRNGIIFYGNYTIIFWRNVSFYGVLTLTATNKDIGRFTSILGETEQYPMGIIQHLRNGMSHCTVPWYQEKPAKAIHLHFMTKWVISCWRLTTPTWRNASLFGGLTSTTTCKNIGSFIPIFQEKQRNFLRTSSNTYVMKCLILSFPDVNSKLLKHTLYLHTLGGKEEFAIRY